MEHLISFALLSVPCFYNMMTIDSFISFLQADISLEQSIGNACLPKGDTWSVHKFGGTCMGTSKRIQNAADIVLSDSSERKLVIVSAMSKVTDMMYELVNKASSRDDSYISAIDNVYEKHIATARDLLDGEDLAIFLSQLHEDITNLKAMLRAIYIGILLHLLCCFCPIDSFTEIKPVGICYIICR